MEWHSSGIKSVFEELKTDEHGLSSEEAARRLGKYGKNEIEEKEQISILRIFLSQFKSFLVLILVAAVVISLILGDELDAIVIGFVLILNAVLGFVQEYKAETAINSLKQMAALKATVIRNGEKVMIDSKEIVPGDIMIIDEGDKISADARIIRCFSLNTHEAALTGESMPIEKGIETLNEKMPLADRTNMLFSGTLATRGRAIAVVTGTGMDTEIGHVAHLIQNAEKKIPLKEKLDKMGRWLGILVLFLCLIVFGIQVVRGGSILPTLMVAIALAVAAVPEGLPAVVTITLAMGVQRMAKKNALIRKLPSVETLGSTTVICTDKTGTLTMNEMTVRKIYSSRELIDVTGEGYSASGNFSTDPKSFLLLLKIGMMCNNAAFTNSTLIGDPTEGALIVSAMKAGLSKSDLEKELPRIDEIPFSSERKMMTTLHKSGKKRYAFVKGTPEIVLNNCTKFFYDGKIRKLTKIEKEKIIEANIEFERQALRVLGFAFKSCMGKEDAEKELIFAGLQGMIDPPRPEAKESIDKCKKAGIKVVMITGDQKITAEAIAHELGLNGRAISGEELDEMKATDLARIVDDVAVYARVSPQHKIKIVEALKKRGHIVAMTGDGVNDAPALKEANIGIAMGVVGTDVAKESSDMILMDDNFSSIVNAVEEGRGIYDNIRKFTFFLLSQNLGEILVVFLAALMGMPLPFIAIQLLWINIVTDTFPALALGVDPKGEGTMLRKPRSPKENLINKEFLITTLLIAISVSTFTLLLFNKYLPDVKLAQTVAFMAITSFELVVPFIVRARYSSKVFKSPWLILGVAVSILLQLTVVYTPLSKVFNTVPLVGIELAYIAAITLASLALGISVATILRKKIDAPLKH